jgi:tetratricopeptide (TPR) repeat protein
MRYKEGPMAFPFRRSLPILIIGSLTIFGIAGCFSSGPTELVDAEQLTRDGKPDEAIAAYREHIANRLEVSDRPEWENPYFYLLNVGDIELNRGKIDAALAMYEEAERQKVDPALVADRYRAVASWYEEHGELTKALEILTKYREKDPLIFDSMLDRVARELTERGQ